MLRRMLRGGAATNSEAVARPGSAVERLLDEAEELIAKAIQAEESGETQQAKDVFEQGAEVLLRALQQSDTPAPLQEHLRARASFALDRAERLANTQPASQPSGSVHVGSGDDSPFTHYRGPGQYPGQYPSVALPSAPTSLPKTSPNLPRPPPIARTTSLKLSQIAQIRSVCGDGHSDDALRVMLARHGDNVEGVINELLEALISDFQLEEEGSAPPSTLSRPIRSAWEADERRASQGHGRSRATMDAGHQEGTMWTCAACTLQNRIAEQFCAACDQPRPQGQKPSELPTNHGRTRGAAPPTPETLEEFLTSSIGGDVRMVMHLELPNGRRIEVNRALPAEQMRTQLVYFIAHDPLTPPPPGATPLAAGVEVPEGAQLVQPSAARSGASSSVQDGGGRREQRNDQRPHEERRPLPESPPARQEPPQRPSPPLAPSAPPSTDTPGVEATGAIAGARDTFSVPAANQGAFGGERVGLPQHASRKGKRQRGPPQRGVKDELSLEDAKTQLGDGAIRQAIASALARTDASDGNSSVNPDIREDAALYDDGVGGAFERSIFIDPTRTSKAKGVQATPIEQQLAQIRPPKPGTVGRATSLPVAYEVAAVGRRLKNMHRVGGQRVLEMDHFVESVSTPIVRLVLPDMPQPGGSREAVIAARKVLERKLLERSADAPVIPLDRPGAPPLRMLAPLGGKDDSESAPPDAQCHAKVYGELLWDVLVEVVERILRKKAVDVIASLYYMATIRADVFVCSSTASPGEAGDAHLHVNVLCFQQALVCECEGDDLTKPIRVRADKWRTVLPYWLCRVTAALNESRPGSVGGSYDEGTRKRLIERIRTRAGHTEDGHPPLLTKAQKWKPPPLPTEVLTR